MQYIIENLWLILGVIVALTLLGGYLIIATGVPYKVMDWLKPNEAKYLPAKVFCTDKQIRDRKLAVDRYVLSDHGLRRSFYLVHKLLLKKPKGKKSFLALTERSARPIDFHGRMTTEDWKMFPSALKVWLDTTADIFADSVRAAHKNFAMQSLSIIALGAAVIVVVMGIVIFVQSRGGA